MSVSEREPEGSQVIRRGAYDAPARVAPTNGSRAVATSDRPPALVGVPIPGRDRTIRRMVVQLYREIGHLPAASRGVVASYCRSLRGAERVYERWRRSDFSPGRDADLFMKATAEVRQLAAVLGLTPVAIAHLGVDLGKMRDLASAMSEEGDDG